MLRATTLELHIGREPGLELAHHRHEADHLYGHILMIVRRIAQMEDAAGIILAVYEGMATKFLHQSLLAFQTDRQCRERRACRHPDRCSGLAEVTRSAC